jgi:hypothetical protein
MAVMQGRGGDQLEVEGEPDMRGRPGSERREEGEVGVGRRGAVGQKRWGWATRAERVRGKRVGGFLFLFVFLKPFFKTFSNFKFKHLFNFSNFQNILKLNTNKQKHHAFKL